MGPALSHMRMMASIDVSIPSVINNNLIIDNTMIKTSQNSLIIFVVDCSMPMSSTRIDAVKGSALDIMPKVKAAVISCYQHGAEITMEPTSSAILARRRLLQLKKSVKGNLGHGIAMATSMIKSSFEDGVNDVTLAIIADGKAHGLLAETAVRPCEDFLSDMCDVELQEDAKYLSELIENIKASKLNLRTVVIDTEKRDQDCEEDFTGDDCEVPFELLAQGARFAKSVKSEYFHTPDITPQQLSQILMTGYINK
jgi:Mg-chelatase subunit ChlD